MGNTGHDSQRIRFLELRCGRVEVNSNNKIQARPAGENQRGKNHRHQKIMIKEIRGKEISGKNTERIILTDTEEE